MPVPAHPLEPLSPQEISAATELLVARRNLTFSTRFVFVELAEPPKELVTSWQPGTPWDRQAAALLRDRAANGTYEAVVSLTRAEVVSWRLVDGAQPPMMAEEFMACEEVVRGDERWQQAMRLRGVEDFSLAMIDPWAAGYTGPEDAPEARRIARPLTFVRSRPDDNGYARAVEGLIVTVDLDRMVVIDVADHGVVPLPPRPGNYYPELATAPGNVPAVDQLRAPLRPISITQPDGPSFEVDGRAAVTAAADGPVRISAGRPAARPRQPRTPSRRTRAGTG
jgi:primary-amine oxidase